MTMTPARSFAPLALVACVAPASLAQQVTFSPDLKSGEEMTYEMTTRLEVGQTVDGQTSQQTIEHTAGFTMTVESVAGDGSATVSLVFDSLAMSIAMGETAESFTWQDTGGDRPNAAMGEGLNASGFALAGAELGFTVDADGEVGNVTGLDAFLSTINAGSASDVAFVGAFTPERFAEAIEPIFDGDGGAGEPREKGASWKTSERVELGAVGAIVLTRDYSYLHFENGMANVIGSLSVKLEKPDAPAADAPTVSLDGHQGAGVIQWDAEARELVQYGRTEQMTTTWTMGDSTVRQTQRSVTRLARGE